jgi:hypothetical protein
MKTDIAYIYSLTDPETKKIRYIGKTVNPKYRLREHLYESVKTQNYRCNWIRGLIKRGLTPIFNILEICPVQNFEEREAYHISLYDFKELTNSDEKGQGNKNRRRELVENANYKNKKVYQYDLNGNFIKEYKSTREAARQLSISHGNITRCCNKIAKHASGFIFSYKQEKQGIVSRPNAVKLPIMELDSDGNTIQEWNSLMDCSRDTKIDNGNLSRVCNGKLKHIKGRIFKFKNK